MSLLCFREAARLAVLAGVLLSASAQAQVDIRVQGSGGRALQVAVQQFTADEFTQAHEQAFDKELAHALQLAGPFQLVDREAFLEPRKTQDLGTAFLPCENWKGIGADVVLQGRLEKRRSGVRVRYRVWDVGRCQLQGKRGYLDSEPDRLWYSARVLADEIVRRFTGTRGVASTQIAFVSDRSGRKEIYIAESDGSRPRQVTRNGSINLFPAWSPDGKSLIYTSYRTGRSDLWTLTRGRNGGGRLTTLPNEKYRGIFGPADNQVTFVMNEGGNTDIFVARRDGRGMKRLTRSRAIDVSPSWSPDGKQMAFASDRPGSQQLYILDVSTDQVRRITFKGKYNASPAWSPRGDWIVYAARTGTSFDLYLIDPDTGYTTPLVVHPRSDESPVWSPDGRRVLFTSSRRGRKDLYVVDLDGKNLRRLTRDYGNCSAPSWSGWFD